MTSLKSVPVFKVLSLEIVGVIHVVLGEVFIKKIQFCNFFKLAERISKY